MNRLLENLQNFLNRNGLTDTTVIILDDINNFLGIDIDSEYKNIILIFIEDFIDDYAEEFINISKKIKELLEKEKTIFFIFSRENDHKLQEKFIFISKLISSQKQKKGIYFLSENDVNILNPKKYIYEAIEEFAEDLLSVLEQEDSKRRKDDFKKYLEDLENNLKEQIKKAKFIGIDLDKIVSYTNYGRNSSLLINKIGKINNLEEFGNPPTINHERKQKINKIIKNIDTYFSYDINKIIKEVNSFVSPEEEYNKKNLNFKFLNNIHDNLKAISNKLDEVTSIRNPANIFFRFRNELEKELEDEIDKLKQNFNIFHETFSNINKFSLVEEGKITNLYNKLLKILRISLEISSKVWNGRRFINFPVPQNLWSIFYKNRKRIRIVLELVSIITRYIHVIKVFYLARQRFYEFLEEIKEEIESLNDINDSKKQVDNIKKELDVYPKWKYLKKIKIELENLSLNEIELKNEEIKIDKSILNKHKNSLKDEIKKMIEASREGNTNFTSKYKCFVPKYFHKKEAFIVAKEMVESLKELVKDDFKEIFEKNAYIIINKNLLYSIEEKLPSFLMRVKSKFLKEYCHNYPEDDLLRVYTDKYNNILKEKLKEKNFFVYNDKYSVYFLNNSLCKFLHSKIFNNYFFKRLNFDKLRDKLNKINNLRLDKIIEFLDEKMPEDFLKSTNTFNTKTDKINRIMEQLAFFKSYLKDNNQDENFLLYDTTLMFWYDTNEVVIIHPDLDLFKVSDYDRDFSNYLISKPFKEEEIDNFLEENVRHISEAFINLLIENEEFEYLIDIMNSLGMKVHVC